MVGQKIQGYFFAETYTDDAKDRFLEVKSQIKDLNTLSEHRKALAGPLQRLQDITKRWMDVE
jgi:hypothetical protein